MSTVSFLTQLTLPIECFRLTYYLSGFKSRINRHLLIVFLNIFVLLFSCNSMPLTGCSALHGVNYNLKQKQKKLRNILFENFLSVQVSIETLKKVFTTV